MANTYINLDQVTCIRVYRKSKKKSVKHIKKTIYTNWISRFIGLVPKNIEYYQTYDTYYTLDSPYFDEFLRDNHFYIDETDGDVYFLPHFTFDMSSGGDRDHWFKTVEELETRLANIQIRLPNLIVLNDGE